MAEGMNFSDHGKESLCESCIMGKQHRSPFSKDKPHRANNHLKSYTQSFVAPCILKHLEVHDTLLRL